MTNENTKTTKVKVQGAELNVTDTGTGAAVLFIHPVVLPDAAAPLLADPALKGKYRMITYHRRGFGASIGPTTVETQAADAAAVLDHVGVEKAHIVGISYGAAIALQLAADFPAKVQTLTLCEPPLFNLVPSAPQFMEAVGPVVAAYQEKNLPGARDMFLGAIGGPNVQEHVDKKLPSGSWASSVNNLDTFFQVEFPALGEWKFGAEQAKTIKVPTLFFKSTDSHPAFREGADVLAPWIPQMKVIEVKGANHLAPVTHTSEVAGHLASFLSN